MSSGWEDLWFESGDGLRLHARDYAAPGADAGTLLCMHGLSRNAADFEPLAERYGDRWRLVVPEQRGRGRSAHDPDPSRYQVGTYVRDTLTLVDELRLERPVAVGTSMGGLMTAFLAAARPGLFRAAVINDIGPVVEATGLARIRSYVGRSAPVRTWAEAVAQVRAANGDAFPDLDGPDWETFTRRLYVEDPESGVPVPAYDPAIAQPLNQEPDSAVPPDLWSVFDALAGVPVLLLRGERSDILGADTAAALVARLPQATLVEVPRVGHAPTLAEPVVQQALDRFLAAL
jgi:pimeloyl-ACP methyl ester carboxylesterase